MMECLLPYLCMVTVPHIMVGLEKMLDYRGVGLERFHCTHNVMYLMYSCFQSSPSQDKSAKRDNALPWFSLQRGPTKFLASFRCTQISQRFYQSL